MIHVLCVDLLSCSRPNSRLGAPAQLVRSHLEMYHVAVVVCTALYNELHAEDCDAGLINGKLSPSIGRSGALPSYKAHNRFESQRQDNDTLQPRWKPDL